MGCRRDAEEIANRAEDTARRGFETAQKTAGAVLEVERAVVRRSAEGATEVGQVFTKLAKEQAQNNIETFQALARTLDWSQVAQIHGDFLRASMERAAEFTKRYFEVVQTVVASTDLDGQGAGPQDGLTRSPRGGVLL